MLSRDNTRTVQVLLRRFCDLSLSVKWLTTVGLCMQLMKCAFSRCVLLSSHFQR